MKIKIWKPDNICNFGDRLNIELIKYITGKEPEVIDANKILDEENYLCIGSILHYADKNSTVWGSGFLDFNYYFPTGIPKKIYSVRGQLTRSLIENLGIKCPEIYGDPALLISKYYRPKAIKKYEIGIVTHWSEKDISICDKNILKISSDLPVFDFINAINSCSYIASSSLHGIICADAYGVPAIQINISNKIEQFKFFDYFLSVGRPLLYPIKIDVINRESILKRFYPYKLKIDTDKILEVCPFR